MHVGLKRAGIGVVAVAALAVPTVAYAQGDGGGRPSGSATSEGCAPRDAAPVPGPAPTTDPIPDPVAAPTSGASVDVAGSITITVNGQSYRLVPVDAAPVPAGPSTGLPTVEPPPAAEDAPGPVTDSLADDVAADASEVVKSEEDGGNSPGAIAAP